MKQDTQEAKNVISVFSDIEAEKIEQIEKAKQLYFLLNEYSFNPSKSVAATIKSSF
jgi:hypothetical protein